MEVLEEYAREMHAHIDSFETRMSEWLCEVKILDLSGPREEIDTLHSQVQLISKSHILVVPPIILSLIHPLPRAHIVEYDLFLDDDVALIIGAKRGCEKELYDPTINYQQDLEWESHHPVVPAFVDE